MVGGDASQNLEPEIKEVLREKIDVSTPQWEGVGNESVSTSGCFQASTDSSLLTLGWPTDYYRHHLECAHTSSKNRLIDTLKQNV